MHPQRRPDPDRTPEALAARLRALGAPPVPAGLEARLLADIPAERPTARRRWAVAAGLVGALAAACVLALLAWPRRDVQRSPGTSPVVRQHTPRPPDDDRIVGWREARQVLDVTATPTFNWPLQETPPLRRSTSIPPDLLN